MINNPKIAKAADSLAAAHDAWLKRQQEREALNQNPCVKQFGAGPEGKRCGDCSRLYARRYTRTYWKCSERDHQGRSAASDHRLSWPACAKYDELREKRKTLATGETNGVDQD